MSLQESQEQFKNETEEPLEEIHDSSNDSPLSDSDANAPSKESESASVPVARKQSSSSSSDAEEMLPPEAVEGPAWYVIHCYSGYENKVRHNLEQRIETMGMRDKIFDVVIPTQEEIEVKDGKRRTVERHIFPGYVLVNMALTEESWYVVRNTPRVTGFVGPDNTTPTPLSKEEVESLLTRMGKEESTFNVDLRLGDLVKITDGPFKESEGKVSEIDEEKGRVKVMVLIFGRETPVDLDSLQVKKV